MDLFQQKADNMIDGILLSNPKNVTIHFIVEEETFKEIISDICNEAENFFFSVNDIWGSRDQNFFTLKFVTYSLIEEPLLIEYMIRQAIKLFDLFDNAYYIGLELNN